MKRLRGYQRREVILSFDNPLNYLKMETSKKNCLLLQRRLNGFNSISEIKIEDSEISDGKIRNGPAIINFWEFLEQNHLDYYNAVVELAQVIKVPIWKLTKLIETKERGFITIDASKNILHYLTVRISPKAISFLQSQQGEAGTSNKEIKSLDEDS